MANPVETVPACPETGAPMYRDTRPMTVAYKGETATFDMPGWYCDASEESIHSGSDLKVSDRALTELKAKVEGRLTPKAVKRIRKRLKLTQKDAGHLIGGGPNAFQKYECGDVLVAVTRLPVHCCCWIGILRVLRCFKRNPTHSTRFRSNKKYV